MACLCLMALVHSINKPQRVDGITSRRTPWQGSREPLRISPQKNLKRNGNSTRTHGEGLAG